MPANLIPLLKFIPLILGIFAGLWVLSNSVAVAKGNQIITLERRWFGKPMPDGRTVALSDEVGVQARVLGPGFHLLIPFLYKVNKFAFTIVPKGQVGLVRAITGANPTGSLMAKHVDCDYFQDGEAFLKSGGQKGPQLMILPEGEYKINPLLFQVKFENAILIGEDEVGVVEAADGEQITRVGGNFGSPVDCNSFQNASAFLANGGQKGPQVAFLKPGFYRINLMLFRVEKRPITEIPGGKMGLIEATDGARIPEGRLLGQKVTGHSNFTDGEAFLANGGEKGRQLEVLMPGRYYINTMLFQVCDVVDWVGISADEVGIVTVKEGRPILDSSKIAADELSLDVHDNFQNPAAFLEKNGQKGLQIPVLRAGNYAINPWFAQVDKVEMVRVEIGTCGVVTSYVGPDGEDITDNKVNARIVANGNKGIWSSPLQPGKHPLNTKICKVDIVPTTQILLNWADNQSSAHNLDSGLSTITLRTADAFNVKMDVSVIIHIPMDNAPKVIATLGSVKSMISQVLEPAISSHFRNAAQYIKALDLYTERRELQARAKEHIAQVLQEHHIDSKDTLIADVILPAELTKTVTDRQIAEQEKKTFATQKEAQEERRALENATAQAAMQPKVVESERQVEIEQNKAQAAVKRAEGEKSARVLAAEGDKQAKVLAADGEKQAQVLAANGEAEATKLRAGADAEATKLRADANAEATTKVGEAEAAIILAKGRSNAESYKLEVEAMGQENFGRIRVMQSISSANMKLIPETLIMGGGGQGGGSALLDSYLGLGLLKTLGVPMTGLGKVEDEKKDEGKDKGGEK